MLVSLAIRHSSNFLKQKMYKRCTSKKFFTSNIRHYQLIPVRDLP